MNVIKFTLGGRFAFFKKPDVNTYLYFTYGMIHRIALLGLFGAILGDKGYNGQDKKKDEYPEFYEHLKNLKIAIVPKEKNTSKKVQTFNNSVGYASKEAGGNLIVKEQWLENPCWSIYVMIQDKESQALAEALLQKNFVYLPYLGKNDHPADIYDISLVEDVSEIKSFETLDSIFIKNDFQLIPFDDLEDLEDLEAETEPIFKYEEVLPVELEKHMNQYEYRSFIFTNSRVKKQMETAVYQIQGKNIVFF